MTSATAFRAALAILVVSVASPALAGKGFNYTYVDAGYEYTDGDEVNFKTARVDGSFDVFKYVALRAAFRRGELDNYSKKESDPDFNEFQAGARAHYSLFDSVDLFAGGNWFYNSINGSKVSSISDAGYIVDGGVRYRPFSGDILKRLELDAWVQYRSGDFDDTSVAFNPIIKVTKKLSVNLRTNQFGDDDIYYAGLRLDL